MTYSWLTNRGLTYKSILFCAGMNLILVQYWTMKEYLLVLDSSEVTILLVAGAFFASCSLGFVLPFKRIQQNFKWLFTLLCIAQLSFPLLFKEIASAICHYEIPHFTLILLGFGTLVMSPLYTILLPYFIERQEIDTSIDHGNALPICYGIELGGGLIGVCLILTLGRISFPALVALYFLNLSIIMAFIYESRKILLAAIPISLCYWFIYLPLDHMGSRDFYRYETPDYNLIASAQSIYNRIDVLQDDKGDKLLLMNGREYFNSTDLEAFNECIAGIPSALMPGSRLLIVGTGSLSSVYHASRFAESVESVELDPQVVKISMDHFRKYSHIDEVKNWTLHIDDAKHFLGSTQKKYDLIIIDLVPPIYVQTALLYTREFYELAKQHLSPQGVLSIYTGLLFGTESYMDTVNTPECTIDAVFPEYLVLNSDAADMAFIYASPDLPFKKQELVAHLKSTGTYGKDEVFEPADVRPTLHDMKVISMDNLGIVLEWSPWDFDPLTSRLGDLP
jgi:spermidine synthase